MSRVFNIRLLALPAATVAVALALIASTVPAQASALDFFPSRCDSHDLRVEIHQCLTNILGENEINHRKDTAYIAGGSGVVPANVATGQPGAAIKVAGAGAIAIPPNGKTAYVASSAATVTPIKTAAGKLARSIKVGSGPEAIAIAPGGSHHASVRANGGGFLADEGLDGSG